MWRLAAGPSCRAGGGSGGGSRVEWCKVRRTDLTNLSDLALQLCKLKTFASAPTLTRSRCLSTSRVCALSRPKTALVFPGQGVQKVSFLFGLFVPSLS